MTLKFYAQGTCFCSSTGTYSFLDRCEITKAVGYGFQSGMDVTGQLSSC